MILKENMKKCIGFVSRERVRVFVDIIRLLRLIFMGCTLRYLIIRHYYRCTITYSLMVMMLIILWYSNPSIPRYSPKTQYMVEFDHCRYMIDDKRTYEWVYVIISTQDMYVRMYILWARHVISIVQHDVWPGALL